MSHLGKLVAVRFVDGTLLKGWTADFRPDRDFFHLKEREAAAPRRVSVEGLKGIFFIKTRAGNPHHDQRKAFDDHAGPEKPIWVLFTDGEALAGWSSSASSLKNGFYLVPADPDSNLERAYVFHSAVERLLEGEEAMKASTHFGRLWDRTAS